MVPVLRESDPLTAPMVGFCWWEPIKEFHFLGHIIYKLWAYDLSVWTSKSFLVSVRPGVCSLLLGCESNSLERQSLQKLILWHQRTSFKVKLPSRRQSGNIRKKCLGYLKVCQPLQFSLCGQWIPCIARDNSSWGILRTGRWPICPGQSEFIHVVLD